MSKTLDHYNRTAVRYAEVNHQLSAPLRWRKPRHFWIASSRRLFLRTAP